MTDWIFNSPTREEPDLKYPNARTAGVLTILLIVTVAAVLIGIGAVVVGATRGATASQSDIFAVSQGEFDVTVPASGEFSALNQIEIKNDLEVRAVITEIVDEGIIVRKGDVLFKLNDEDMINRVKDMQNSVDEAQNRFDTATADLEIMIKERESKLAEADVTIELAELAMKSWEKGDSVSRESDLKLAIKTAQKNYDRLVDRFEASKRLLEQEFISEDEYLRDEIELIEADAKLIQANLDLEVYMEYTIKQDRKKKESDLKQAKDERERTEASYKARVASARSTVQSRKNQLDSDTERLADARDQLERCIVYAPSDGLVVYASSIDRGGWRDDSNPPQVGTELYRNQTVIVLPDTSKMVAEVKINEALSGLIEPGQLATIRSDAQPDDVLSGEVLSIGVLAESGGWRDPNRRDYTVRIRLDGDNDNGLKPSMRCKANIYVDKVDDATYVPVQSVFRTGPLAYVYVPDGSGYAQREVELGRASELYVEVLNGVQPGDDVLTRKPKPERITVKLEAPEQKQRGPGSGPKKNNSSARVAANETTEAEMKPGAEPGS